MMYAKWRKSTYSLSNGNCVDVGTGQAQVAVRDSKDPDGPVIGVSPRAWIEFTEHVKRDIPAARTLSIDSQRLALGVRSHGVNLVVRDEDLACGARPGHAHAHAHH